MAKTSIMVVEDEGLIAEQIKMSLEKLGYDVPLVALSGEEALSKIHTAEVDLVLLDIKLGEGMSGIEIAREIVNPMKIPVIFLTAYTDKDTVERAKAVGPYGFILKPFEDRALDIAIQMAVEKAQKIKNLERSFKIFNSVFRAIDEAVIETDRKGYILHANAAAAEIAGRSTLSLIGENILQIGTLFHEDGAFPTFFPIYSSAFEGRRVYQENCVFLSTENKRTSIDYVSSPMRNETGSITGVILEIRRAGHQEQHRH